MCLAQPMMTTSSRSARSQRVVSVRWAVSGCSGSGMANNFSGSATRRWDTMMLEEPAAEKTENNRLFIKIQPERTDGLRPKVSLHPAQPQTSDIQRAVR